MLSRLIRTATREARRAGARRGGMPRGAPPPGGVGRGGPQRDIERGARTILRGLLRRR